MNEPQPHSGIILFVVGTSSAGKSSTIRELQDILEEHYLALGIDTFFHMVSPRWGGGMDGPLSREGFWYHRYTDGATPVTRIKYGEVGKRVLRGMHDTVAALAQTGNNVIVDEMLLDREVLHDWLRVLPKFNVLIARLWSPIETLEEREKQRGNKPGLARGHIEDNQIPHWDIEIDTSQYTPQERARLIRDYLYSGHTFDAIRRYTNHPGGER